MDRQELDVRVEKVWNGIQALADHIRTTELSPVQLADYQEKLKILQKEYRILRSQQSILFFTYEYFSEDRNAGNDNNLIPAGISYEQAPDFHRQLTEQMENVCWEEITANIGWACPRGHAKTTYLSNVLPIYSIVFNLRKYIVIISETGAMSSAFIEWISGQLKYNQKLREDFGNLLDVSKTLNKKDNNEVFETKNGILVRSSAMGKQLRGARHGAYRPDLVIMDDLESEKNTNTKELREKNLHWFNKVIRPIGDPTRTSFIYMGTLVHGQGLLPSVLKMSDFESEIFSAILQYPERVDLWDHVEEMLRDLTNDTRLEDAWEFYRQNQKEMDVGVELLWAGRFTYFDLIRRKVDMGSRAFASEYLNRPAEDEDKIFKPEYFRYYTDTDLFDKNGMPLRFSVFAFWDQALGKNKRSDYNAIVVIGVEKRTGLIYVLEAWASKCPLHVAEEKYMDFIMKHKVDVAGVETVGAFHESYRRIKQKLQALRWYKTRIKAVNSTSKKEARIESLEPLFENGNILMRQSHHFLQEMLDQFPYFDYDDLPDALEGAVALVKNGGRSKTRRKKPQGM